VVSFNGRFGTVNPAEGDYTLTQLGDVIITSPSNGQVLKYNGSNWVNASDVTEADTLDTVTTRGNTTANSITVGSVTAAGLSNLIGQIRTFATTGNTYMGANPGSATDAGFKLDVLGTTRLNGNTTVTGVLTGSDTIRSTNGTVTASISYGSTAGIIGTTSNHSLEIRTNNIFRIGVSTAGVLNIANLIGTGSRIVVADAAGNLSASSALTGYVTLDTAQTITATKTFSSGIVVSNSGIQISGGTTDYLNVETGGEKTYFGTSFIRAWDKQSGGSRIINLRPSGLAAGSDYTVSFPAKSGTIAFTDDIPSVAGVYLPLAGGTLTGGLIGTTGSFAASGSGDTFAINHSSGSGIALNITKAGNGEGLYINKTSGSGNAATIIGTLNATTLVKSGGTSSQFLKADGSLDSSTYLTSASVSGVYLPLSGGTLTGALNGTSASFSSTVTAYGNAATSSSFNAYNSSGISGIAQYYQDFGNGAGFVAGRILRGNGASGLEANGLNIDNHTGFKVRLNQLGGSGGVFTIDGGNVAINTTSAPERLTVAGAIMSTGAITGHGANRTTLSQEGLNGAYWQSYGANTSTVGTFVLRQASSDFSVTRTPLVIDATGAATFSGNLLVSVNQNNSSVINISNTTAGTSSQSTFQANSDATSGYATFGKFSSSTNAYKIIAASNAFLYTDKGDIAILNDNASGAIKLAAGASSTAHLTIASTGAATFSSSVTAGGFLANGSTAIGSPIDTGATKAYFDASSINGAALTLRSDGVGRTIRLISDNSGTTTAAIDCNSTGLVIGTNSNHPLVFTPNATERMRITSGGAVCINETSSILNSVLTVGQSGSTGANSVNICTNHFHVNTKYIDFGWYGTSIGSITNSGGTSVSFNTSSDYRLKKDLKDFNGIELLNAINFYDFAWKADDSRTHGVIAHELQSILPYAVTGEKDGKNMQGVDYSKLVPVMAKAIKELTAQIEQLKSK
jgi:hypothetical protein